jgi:hypothetical protein
MTPEERAERVAEIARVYACRRKHRIPNTRHTVRRLLEAVSDLIGRRVTAEERLGGARAEGSRERRPA